MIRGLDFSVANGTIDFAKVAAAGFSFAIVKVTEGGFRDPNALKNLAGARAAGLATGIYAFARISLGAPEPQAQALWDACGDQMPDLPPALDLESAPAGMTPAQVVTWAEAWAVKAESLFGRPPMLYTYPDFEKRELGVAAAASTILARCYLWMADYSGGESPPPGWHPFVPKPWTTWTLAQVSGNNSSMVDGVPWHVDHNVFNGDETAFARFRGIPDPGPTVPDVAAFIDPDDAP